MSPLPISIQCRYLWNQNRRYRYIVDIFYCGAFWPSRIFYYRPQSSQWRKCYTFTFVSD